MSNKKASTATRADTVELGRTRATIDSVGAALAWGRSYLERAATASLDTQLLLGHVLQRERSWILSHIDSGMSAEQTEAFVALMEQRFNGVPVAYLRGYREWYGHRLRVSPSVLIPRPETELLVDTAIALAGRRHLRVLADVGTGSGAIAVQLALELPDTHVFGIDTSPEALEIARHNAAARGIADRITWLAGDLLAPLEVEPDLIVANLPYLSDAMMDVIGPEVRHEPALALYGGRTGLELYRRMFEQRRARGWSVPLIIEMDPRQAAALTTMARDEFDASRVRIAKDYAGYDRFVVVDE